MRCQVDGVQLENRWTASGAFPWPASALICLVLWAGGLRLDWTYWILHWLSFSSISLLV